MSKRDEGHEDVATPLLGAPHGYGGTAATAHGLDTFAGSDLRRNTAGRSSSRDIPSHLAAPTARARVGFGATVDPRELDLADDGPELGRLLHPDRRRPVSKRVLLQQTALLPLLPQLREACAALSRRRGAVLSLLLVEAGVVVLQAYTWEGLSSDAWISMAVVLALLVGLLAEVASTAVCFLFALAVLMGAQVLEPQSLLSGFGNETVFAIGCLTVVSAGVKESTLLSYISTRLLGRPTTVKSALLRLLPLVAAMSVFVSNTALVCLFVPVVEGWSRQSNLPTQQILMPMAFAIILGGMCSQVGTSVNLIVVGLAQNLNSNSTHTLELDVDLFDPAAAGLPAAAISIVYMVLMAEKLLPARGSFASRVAASSTDSYRCAMIVPTASPLDGVELGKSGLTALPGVVLYEIDRPSAIQPVQAGTLSGAAAASREESDTEADRRWSNVWELPAHDEGDDRVVSIRLDDKFNALQESSSSSLVDLILEPSTTIRLKAGMVLYFSGSAEALAKYLYRMEGIEPAETSQVAKLPGSRRARRLAVAILAHDSPLVGRTLTESRFRDRFNAVALALRRRGQAPMHVVDVPLRGGDGLLLECGPGFLERCNQEPDFALVSELAGETMSVLPVERPRHAFVALVVLSLIIVGSTSGIMPISAASLIGAFVLILTRCISSAEAIRSVKGSTLIVIACGLGLARALSETGAAPRVALSLQQLVGDSAPFFATAVIFFVAALLSSIISPTAAATLMWPITQQLAIGGADTALEADRRVANFMNVLMLAGSCCFCSPFSYTVNLMVAEVADYKAADFIRFGGPVLIITAATTLCVAEFLGWGVGEALGGGGAGSDDQ